MTTRAELALCQHGRTWLLDAGNDALGRPRTGARDALRALLGAAICERAVREPPSAAPSAALARLAQGVARRLAADYVRGTFQLLDYDPKLLLLCRQVLSASGVQSPVLDRLARTLADAARRRPAAHTEVRFAGERLLLAAMGYVDAAPSPAWTWPVSFERLITADLSEIRTTCGRVAACTGYGTVAARVPPPAHAELRAGLAVVMLHALRRYDLVTGALLLRSLSYLGEHDSRPICCAVSFLQAQQQPDGRFGYLAMEASQVETVLHLDPVGELYLPVTVSCIWALTEILDRGLRLFGPPMRQ